jgi:6-phosphogluconolactonase
LVREVYVEEVNRYRITFTEPLINAARTVVFLVYGSSKAAAVYDVLEGPHDYKRYPAQLVSPSRGDVHWFMDEAAAGGVDTGR